MGDVVVEHVGQARAEHPVANTEALGLGIPGQRFTPVRGAAPAALCGGSPLHETGALRPSLGIAVVAAWADFLAAIPGVECVVRPLDLSVLAHHAILTTLRCRSTPTRSRCRSSRRKASPKNGSRISPRAICPN